MAREWVRSIVRLLLAVAVLGAVYLGAAWWTGRHLPSEVVVEGVSLGGLSPEQAADRLTKDFGPRAAAPVTVLAGTTGASFTLDPGAAGLALDLPATLDGLSGVTLDPRTLWARLTGRVDRPLVRRIDTAQLTAAVALKAATITRPAVEGAVSFLDGAVQATTPASGLSVSVDDAVRRIALDWPRESRFVADAEVLAPTVGQGAVDAAVHDFATPAMSGPLTVALDDQVVSVTPAEYAGALGMVPGPGGTLVGSADAAALRDLLRHACAGLLTSAQDAHFEVQGDQPVLVPATVGTTVDPAGLDTKFLAALTSADRRLTLTRVPAPAAVSTESLAALGITAQVGAFDSASVGDAGALANLDLAARAVDGTIVRPGESFSLNRVLGERTPAKGYLPGDVIIDGQRVEKAVGGGISQLATVVYNLAALAGTRIDERHAHTVYLSTYPAGRDAVISWPDLDLAWTDTTPNALFVHTWVADGQVHGRIFGTPWAQVSVAEGPRTSSRAASSIRDGSAACVPMTPEPGFDITVRWTVTPPDGPARTDAVVTKYNAAPGVTCIGH